MIASMNIIRMLRSVRMDHDIKPENTKPLKASTSGLHLSLPVCHLSIPLLLAPSIPSHSCERGDSHLNQRTSAQKRAYAPQPQIRDVQHAHVVAVKLHVRLQLVRALVRPRKPLAHARELDGPSCKAQHGKAVVLVEQVGHGRLQLGERWIRSRQNAADDENEHARDNHGAFRGPEHRREELAKTAGEVQKRIGGTKQLRVTDIQPADRRKDAARDKRVQKIVEHDQDISTEPVRDNAHALPHLAIHLSFLSAEGEDHENGRQQ
mmetsp:Transcript_13330/g.30534  ORF Transcript_13330/g.30534 Transcript_13330/m.30534 type:complete len:264 (-) Transcript_13330:2127-2918(-)